MPKKYVRTVQTMNHLSRGPRKKSASVYKGVTYRKDKKHRPWGANITFQGKTTHLGYYVTEEEAAIAYDEHARVLFGEFAYLNRAELPVNLDEIKEEREKRRNVERLAKKTSQYLGVSRRNHGPISRPWRVQIYYQGRQKCLGWFATEREAAECYNAAAYFYHGASAVLNIIQEEDTTV